MSRLQKLDELFPAHIGQPPSSQSPSAAPGVSDASAKALAKCLKDNHVNFHVFFNDKGFHNHLSHHLFAAYKMGATPSLIQAAYDEHAPMQRAAFRSPDKIDESNWKQHLGDDEYYAAYLDFFADHVLKNGMGPTLSKYIFSSDANWGSETDPDKAPRMLDRFFAGLLHPLINYGHGPEFGVPGMAVEGLAWTVVHNPTYTSLLPPEFFAPSRTDSTLSRMAQSLRISSAPQAASGLHAFTLLARMLKDPALAPGSAVTNIDSEHKLMDALALRGDVIYSYASQWADDVSSSDKLATRIEELQWVAVLTYGVGGWSATRDTDFLADFFLMHLVTSSLFLPSILAQLDKSAQSALLRAYASVSFATWISRGRPKLDIKTFYQRVSSTPLPPIEEPKPDTRCLDKEHLTQNPWYAILQSALSYPEEHLVKTQRALAHYGSIYGDRPKGHWSGTELEGAEELDGSLFVRVAGLTMKRLGAVREGEPKGDWDRIGFYEN